MLTDDSIWLITVMLGGATYIEKVLLYIVYCEFFSIMLNCAIYNLFLLRSALVRIFIIHQLSS